MSNKEVFRIIREIDPATKDYPNLFNFLRKLPRRTWADIVLDFADKHAAAEITGFPLAQSKQYGSNSVGDYGDSDHQSLDDGVPVLSEVIGSVNNDTKVTPVVGDFVCSETDQMEGFEPIRGLDEDEDDIERILKESLELITKPGEKPAVPFLDKPSSPNPEKGFPESQIQISSAQSEARSPEGFLPPVPIHQSSSVAHGVSFPPHEQPLVSDVSFLDKERPPASGQTKNVDDPSSTKNGQKKGKRRFNLDQLMS